MRRQMPVLRGLAILAVVCNHTAGWGIIAIIWWGHRYRLDGAPPYYDQIGTLPYYALVVIQQLALFSIPAFLFISGFFISYVALGSQSTLSWKVVKARVTNLLWPYLIWSSIIYAGELLEGKLLGNNEGYSLSEFFKRLAIGNVDRAYFFVPLLFQFYLISPLIARLGKNRSKLLLGVSALVQIMAIGALYLMPDEFRLIADSGGGGAWMFIWWTFYFPFGVVCGFHYEHLKQLLARFKRELLISTAVLGALSIFESEILYRLNLSPNWIRGPFKFSSFLYALAFILFFLTVDAGSIPFASAIQKIGAHSYGIYLLHGNVIRLVAKAVYHFVPWLLAQQILYQPVLIVLAVGIPLLLMAGMARSPAKKFYHYSFG
ncbi:MAG: acyltransferase [Anaerolineae bacterium]